MLSIQALKTPLLPCNAIYSDKFKISNLLMLYQCLQLLSFLVTLDEKRKWMKKIYIYNFALAMLVC